MNKCNRYITSLLLTAIYMVIVFSPLAPLAMQSKLVAHAVTGECSGNCKVDGFSLERSATHTCCCWQKKNRLDDDHLHSKDDHCEIPAYPTTKTVEKGSSCCAVQGQSDHTNSTEERAIASPAPQKQRVATISSRPCGNGKLFSLLSIESPQHLPYIFAGELPSPEQHPLTGTPPDRLLSRHGDPPDPPPIITHRT